MTLVDGLVSIIVPVYNRTALLREAVESALRQTYRSTEVIIVDDGSTCKYTVTEVHRLCEENREVVRSIRQPNRGPGAARQTGMDSSKGEFIQFLDSDDLLSPEKLEWQVQGLHDSPECGLSYGKTREYTIGETPPKTPSRRTGEVHRLMFPRVLTGRLWATETPLYRKTVLTRIGRWSDLAVLEDWEYECRLGSHNTLLHYCDEFVSDHRHHENDREGLRWVHDDGAFGDMLTAHQKVVGYALKADVQKGSPEMQFCARNLFRLARDAGYRGLQNKAGELLNLARDIDGERRYEYLIYEWGAALLGWKFAAALGQRFHDSKSRFVRGQDGL